MTKHGFGKKRLCTSCNAKYYDFDKSPAVCPVCGALFVVPSVARAVSACETVVAPLGKETSIDNDFVSLDVEAGDNVDGLPVENVNLADSIEEDTLLESDADTEAIDPVDIGILVK